MKSTILLFCLPGIFLLQALQGQITWEVFPLPAMPEETTIRDIEISPKGHIYMIADGGFLNWVDTLICARDDGTVWEKLDVGSCGLNDINITSTGMIYIGAGEWGMGGCEQPRGIFYSTNDGQDWGHIEVFGPGCGHVQKVYTSLENDLFGLTCGGALYRWIEDSQAWIQAFNWDCVIGSDPYEYEDFDKISGCMQLKADTGDYYYLSSSKGFFRTDNKGSSWTNLNLNQPTISNEFLTDGGIVVGTAEEGVFYRSPGSTTWQDLGMKNKMIWRIFTLGNQTLFISSDKGVFHSRNLGQEWTALNDGLDAPTIKCMTISPSGHFYISTGKKVYRSKESFPGIYPSYLVSAPSPALSRQPVLGQNYPNPFKQFTSIPFRLDRERKVKVSINTLTGKLVEVVLDEILPAGEHKASWSAGDFEAGVYLYRLEVGEQVLFGRMVYLGNF